VDGGIFYKIIKIIMENQQQLDNVSLFTTQVILFNKNIQVSQGTGFYLVHQYGENYMTFLVTNIHVLTGYAPLDSNIPMGDSIEIFYHLDSNNPKKVKKLKLPLYNSNKKPLWLINQNNPEADLAVIPISHSLISESDLNYFINSKWTENDLKVEVATKAVIIGYPYGRFDSYNFLPFWKSGNIASEPKLDYNGKKIVVLDISAFRGMSGSPAFAIASGSYININGGVTNGSAKKFLGIFASMEIQSQSKYLENLNLNPTTQIGIKDQESLQLGHVWKSEIIFEILNEFNIQAYNEIEAEEIFDKKP
jgi:V8-like Glu-specific endopeptidase